MPHWAGHGDRGCRSLVLPSEAGLMCSGFVGVRAHALRLLQLNHQHGQARRSAATAKTNVPSTHSGRGGEAQGRMLAVQKQRRRQMRGVPERRASGWQGTEGSTASRGLWRGRGPRTFRRRLWFPDPLTTRPAPALGGGAPGAPPAPSSQQTKQQQTPPPVCHLAPAARSRLTPASFSQRKALCPSRIRGQASALQRVK